MLIAKNEADIIEQTLLSLKEYGCFDRVFFYDNGSTDDTFNIARKFSDFVTCTDVSNTVYSDQLKYQLLYSQSHLYADGDWFAILDADEVYAEAVRPKIDFAEATGANYIETNSIQFYLTEKDKATSFDPVTPANEQRKHYLINYGEPRLFKYSSSIILNDKLVKSRDVSLILSAEKLLIKHFQYRSKQQIQMRIDVRKRNNLSSGNWGHVNSEAWEDYVVPARYLHEFDGKFRYGLPESVNLYKTKNNTAYTSGTLRWLLKNGYLNAEQREFLTASRLKRIFKRFL